MSFLDNLESNLRALERQEERDLEARRRDRERREEDRDAAVRTAPFAQALRESAFTSQLLGVCRTEGRRHRIHAQLVWLGDTLRVEGGGKRMDLTPTPEGIVAVRCEGGEETHRRTVDPAEDDPATLALWWLQ